MRLKYILCALFMILIITAIFIPYQGRSHVEQYEDAMDPTEVDWNNPPETKADTTENTPSKAAISQVDDCEKRFQELQKQKEKDDAIINDEKAQISKQTEIQDAAVDAEWKTITTVKETEQKNATNEQKDAESKLEFITNKKSECEGKLPSMDPAITDKRQCCNTERSLKESAQREYLQAKANADQLAKINASLLGRKQTLDTWMRKADNNLDACGKKVTTLKAAVANMREKMGL